MQWGYQMPAEVTLQHYHLWRESVASARPVVELQCGIEPEDTSCVLTVIGRERRGLLADMTALLTELGLNVISGKIFTLPNDSIMDIFQLDDPHSVLATDESATAVYESLYQMVEGAVTRSAPRRSSAIGPDDDLGGSDEDDWSPRPDVGTTAAAATTAATSAAAPAVSPASVPVALPRSLTTATAAAAAVAAAAAPLSPEVQSLGMGALGARRLNLTPIGSEGSLDRLDSILGTSPGPGGGGTTRSVQSALRRDGLSGGMVRSFSNIAVADLEERTAAEAFRRDRMADISSLTHGARLYFYSRSPLARRRVRAHVSADMNTLLWALASRSGEDSGEDDDLSPTARDAPSGEAAGGGLDTVVSPGRLEAVDLRVSVGILYGVRSKVLSKAAAAGVLADPPWRCFSLVVSSSIIASAVRRTPSSRLRATPAVSPGMGLSGSSVGRAEIGTFSCDDQIGAGGGVPASGRSVGGISGGGDGGSGDGGGMRPAGRGGREDSPGEDSGSESDALSGVLNRGRTRTVDFAVQADDDARVWVLGLQSLCKGPRSLCPAEPYSWESLLRASAKMKLRAAAHKAGYTLRAFILRRVREEGEKREAADAQDHGESRRRAALANLQKLRAAETLEVATTEVTRLRAEIRDASLREVVLTQTLKSVQTAWEVNFDEMTLGECIGRGAFSEMRRAEWRGTPVACKVLRITGVGGDGASGTGAGGVGGGAGGVGVGGGGGESSVREFHDEVTTLSKLRHPNIVLFMGACVRPPRMCIITEFCHGGNVYGALRKPSWRQRLSDKDLIHLARDAARGMLCLHSSNIIHRDLKSQNLLLDKPVDTGRPTIKVADFGLSRTLAGSSGSSEGVMTSETGTYRWMASEVIRHEPYSEKVDVYSYGVTLWEFFTCEIPFADMTPIQAAFAVADKGMRPTAVSEAARSHKIPRAWAVLIDRCWSEAADVRPSFSDVIAILNEMQALPTLDLVPPFFRRGVVTAQSSAASAAAASTAAAARHAAAADAASRLPGSGR